MDFTITPRNLTQEERISIWDAEFQPSEPTGFDAYYRGLKPLNIVALSLKNDWWEDSIVNYSESDLVGSWLDSEYIERQQDMKNLAQYLLLTRDKSTVERSDYLTCLWAERSKQIYRMAKFKYANDLLTEKYPTLDSTAREAIVIDWLSPGFCGELPEPILKLVEIAIAIDLYDFDLWLENKYGCMAIALDELLGFLVRAHQVDPDSPSAVPSADAPNNGDGEVSSAAAEIAP